MAKSHMHTDHILLIAVIGIVHSEKSAFISSCLDPDHHRVIQGPKTCIPYESISSGGKSVTLIDVPGFDSKRRFHDVLAMVKEFVNETYEYGRRLDGLIYVHHKFDALMGGVSLQHMNMLQRLLGMNASTDDLIITHMWDEAVDKAQETAFPSSSQYIIPALDQEDTEQSPRYDIETTQSILRHLIETRPTPCRAARKVESRVGEKQEKGEIQNVRGIAANAEQDGVWDSTSHLGVLQILRGNQDGVFTVTFSPDGKRVASGSLHGCRIWDVVSGVEFTEISVRNVRSVRFSPDGTRVATGSEGGTIHIFGVLFLPVMELVTIQAHGAFVYAVDFSPDGTRIVSSGADKTVHIWDAVSGANLFALYGHSSFIWSVAFSPDGRSVISGSDDKSVRIWDANSGAPVLKPLGESRARITSVACSPDGKRIAAGTHDGTIRVWDALSGVEVFETLRGKTYVLSVAFSPDGKRIVSGSSDYIVRMWDATSGVLVLERSLGSGAQGATFSPDGKSIVVGRADGTVCVWGLRNSLL